MKKSIIFEGHCDKFPIIFLMFFQENDDDDDNDVCETTKSIHKANESKIESPNQQLYHDRIIAFVFILVVSDIFTITSMFIGYKNVHKSSEYLIVSSIITIISTVIVVINAIVVLLCFRGSGVFISVLSIRVVIGFVFAITFGIFFCILPEWQHEPTLIYALVSQIIFCIGFCVKIMSTLYCKE